MARCAAIIKRLLAEIQRQVFLSRKMHHSSMQTGFQRLKLKIGFIEHFLEQFRVEFLG